MRGPGPDSSVAPRRPGFEGAHSMGSSPWRLSLGRSATDSLSDRARAPICGPSTKNVQAGPTLFAGEIPASAPLGSQATNVAGRAVPVHPLDLQAFIKGPLRAHFRLILYICIGLFNRLIEIKLGKKLFFSLAIRMELTYIGET